MNPKVPDLAEDSIFEDASPELFGDKFAKEAKKGRTNSNALTEPRVEVEATIFTTAAL